MMKRMFIILLAGGALYAAEGPATAAVGNVQEQQDKGMFQDEAFWSQFDNLPEAQLPTNRGLPRYLKWIEKPAALLLIHACNTWDLLWVQYHFLAQMMAVALVRARLSVAKSMHYVVNKCTAFKRKQVKPA